MLRMLALREVSFSDISKRRKRSQTSLFDPVPKTVLREHCRTRGLGAQQRRLIAGLGTRDVSLMRPVLFVSAPPHKFLELPLLYDMVQEVAPIQILERMM